VNPPQDDDRSAKNESSRNEYRRFRNGWLHGDLLTRGAMVIKAAAIKGYCFTADGRFFSPRGRELKVSKLGQITVCAIWCKGFRNLDLPYQFTVSASRFVAYTIWGDRALDRRYRAVCRDGNPQNVTADNVVLVTVGQRNARAVRAKAVLRGVGKPSSNAALDTKTAAVTREAVASGLVTIRQAADSLNVPYHLVQRIASGTSGRLALVRQEMGLSNLRP
jgi:hypothetical protein